MCSLFLLLIVNDVMSPRAVEYQNKVSNRYALLTPTYDNLTSADEVKWHQFDSLYIIIPNIFSNLHCDKNNDLFSNDRYFTIVCHRVRTLNASIPKWKNRLSFVLQKKNVK